MDPLYFVNQLWQYPLFLIGYGLLAGFGTWVAFTWAKHPVRWVLGFVIFGMVFLFLTLKVPPLDERLPRTFANPHFYKVWLLGLALTTLLLGTHLVMSYVRLTRPESAEAEGEGKFPDIDAAWQEITIQLSQARIDPAAHNLYLLIAPDEGLAASVVEAAGLTLFATAPTSPESPLHCYAAADALILSCAGALSFGRGGGTERLEHLCGLITAVSPERPTLRGIAVLVPFDWASGSDTLRRVAPVRDDVQSIRRAFKVRCPVLAIFCMNESMPGFTEFATRLPSNLRQSRCGFSVPSSLPFSNDVSRRGMAWMALWFQSWSLNLMVQEIRNQDGNNRLLGMNAAFWRGKEVLAGMLESGLTMHRQAEPVFFRGCYFVACAPEPQSQAFAAGLLRGKKGRLLADSDLTSWSLDADRLDRGYRRACLAIAGVTAAATLPVWIWGINLWRLSQPDVGHPWLGWIGLGLVVLTWGVVLGVWSWKFRRPKAAAGPP